MVTTVTPSFGDLMASIADPDKAKDVFGDPEKAKAWVADIDAARSNELAGVVKEATEQSQQAMFDMLKQEGSESTTTASKRERPKGHARHAIGAQVDGKYDSLGEFVQCIWEKNPNADMRAKASGAQNSINTTNPSDGGFLVPEEFRAELLSVALESAVVRPRATVIPMGSSRVKIPVIDSTSNASTVLGGIQVYWTSEEAALTESAPKFGEVVLDANKLTAYVTVSNEALADSAISVEGIVNRLVPQALAFGEDVKFLRGNGVGEPLGVLNAPATVSVAKETGQAADTIVYENLLGMLQRMLPGSYGTAEWVVNPDTLKELRTMGLAVGTGGSAVWGSDASQGLPPTILGRPYIISEKASTVGDVGDISLIDFSYYYIGDRQMMTAETSPHYLFKNDMTAYRFIERLDGRPGILSAITPHKGAATLSPFVTLAARA